MPRLLLLLYTFPQYDAVPHFHEVTRFLHEPRVWVIRLVVTHCSMCHDTMHFYACHVYMACRVGTEPLLHDIIRKWLTHLEPFLHNIIEPFLHGSHREPSLHDMIRKWLTHLEPFLHDTREPFLHDSHIRNHFYIIQTFVLHNVTPKNETISTWHHS